MRLLVPLLLAALPLGCAQAPFPQPVPESTADLEALQGRWALYRGRYSGWEFSGGHPGCYVEFAGDEYICHAYGEVESRWKVAIDSSKSPKAMKLVCVAPSSRAGETERLRYQVEGNTLTLTSSVEGHGLPGFGEPGKDVSVSILVGGRQ